MMLLRYDVEKKRKHISSLEKHIGKFYCVTGQFYFQGPNGNKTNIK